MAEPQPLPDPVWTESAELCIGCGYSLRGLATPGVCPECGAPFDARQLFLAGVPNSSRSAPTWRRLAWTGIIGGGVIIAFLWPLLLIFHAIVLVILVLGVGAGMTCMLVTSPRERRAVERFVIAPAGIARLPLVVSKGANRLDGVFIPWPALSRVELKRVGPYWRRLKIHGADAPGAGQRLIFDAGVRCPDAAAADVEAAINDLIRTRGAPPAAPAAPISPAPGPSPDSPAPTPQ